MSNGYFIQPLERITRVTGVDDTTTGQTLVNIVGLTLALLANSVYEFEANLGVATSAVVTGCGYGVNFSAAGASVEATISGTLLAASMQSRRITALNTSSIAFLTALSVSGSIIIKGVITTGANAGNLTIQHRKITSGTSTVFRNSFLKARKIG